jgi:hypothetical protein
LNTGILLRKIACSGGTLENVLSRVYYISSAFINFGHGSVARWPVSDIYHVLLRIYVGAIRMSLGQNFSEETARIDCLDFASGIQVCVRKRALSEAFMLRGIIFSYATYDVPSEMYSTKNILFFYMLTLL